VFDLEERLRRWRQELEATLAFSEDELDELDDHLRLAFAAKLREQAPPELAWQLATRNLGTANALAPEFAKDKPMPALGRLAIAWARPLLLIVCFAAALLFVHSRNG
jgi:hypothetical protein